MLYYIKEEDELNNNCNCRQPMQTGLSGRALAGLVAALRTRRDRPGEIMSSYSVFADIEKSRRKPRACRSLRYAATLTLRLSTPSRVEREGSSFAVVWKLMV